MKLAATTVLALIAISTEARSDQLFAIQFGGLIASEQACDLAFEEAAIRRAVDANVPADDLQFLSYFEAGIGTTKRRLGEMSGSTLTAHCAQVRRLAAHFELVTD